MKKFLYTLITIHLSLITAIPQVNQEWVARYVGPFNNDYARSITADGSGNVYVTGNNCEVGENADCITIKYNSAGVQQWVRRYNGPGDGSDAASAIAVDGAENVYVTGNSTVNGTGYDYATIRYSQPVGINPINSEIPKEFSLYQNYPNPFNASTVI